MTYTLLIVACLIATAAVAATIGSRLHCAKDREGTK